MNLWHRIGTCFIMLGLGSLPAAESFAQAPRSVLVATKPGSEWKSYSTRTLEDMGEISTFQANSGLSKYGGMLAKKQKATGFFHTAKIDDRWWLIDPEGCQMFNIGVASVKTIGTSGAQKALADKFGDKNGWAESTVSLLRTNGFNSLGAWSEDESLEKVKQPVAYTRLLGFMAGYGKVRGGTHMQPGHVGYPADCIFVFDAGFESFCNDYAAQLSKMKDDPWLVGYFSDNEMPFSNHALSNFLGLDKNDSGYQAALKFLQSRHGMSSSIKDAAPKDEHDFLAVVATRYFSIVSKAIKKHDPNHLYLGSRFYAVDIAKPELFRACGPYVDVVSMNYYRAWTPDINTMQMWAKESGKPILITEWYAKGVDSGMPNTGGAGWLVKTQHERGLFYQNFALQLIQSKVCVGWHWFRYSDNDLEDKSVDPSNRDSNKGIVNNRYEPYSPLLSEMKPLNERVYAIAEHFDHPDKRNPGEKGD